MQKLVKIWQVGTVNYCKGLQLQRHLANVHAKANNGTATGNNNNNTLLVLEHTPVYTTGIRTNAYQADEEDKLRRLGADFHRTDRGGLITFHGPGQLVVYPILNLRQFQSSMRWYVSQIERTVILLCRKFGIEASTNPHTGVWVGDNKICAIGVHGSRFITTHGLALNCNTNLDWFEHIVPCGISDKGVTSLSKELKRCVRIDEVVPVFLDSFSEVFNCDCVTFPDNEADRILSSVVGKCQ